MKPFSLLLGLVAGAAAAEAAITLQSWSFETGGVYDSGKLFNSNVAEWYDPAPTGSNEASQSETDTDMPLTSAGTDWVNIKQTGLIYTAIGSYESHYADGAVQLTADFGDKSNRAWVADGLRISLYRSSGAASGGDGVSNLIEQAFGNDPQDPSSHYRPLQAIVDAAGNPGNDYLALTYRRLAGGTGSTGNGHSVDGLVYVVESGTTLAPDDWTAGAITVLSVLDDTPEAGIQTVTVRLNSSLSEQGKQQFIRLKISKFP